MVNPMICPCGCDLRPTRRLEVAYELMRKEFLEQLEPLKGIHCDDGYANINVDTMTVRLDKVEVTWQKERIINFLSKLGYPYKFTIMPDCFDITYDVTVTEVSYAEKANSAGTA